MPDQTLGFENDVILTELRHSARAQSLAVSAVAAGGLASLSLVLAVLLLAAQ